MPNPHLCAPSRAPSVKEAVGPSASWPVLEGGKPDGRISGVQHHTLNIPQRFLQVKFTIEKSEDLVHLERHHSIAGIVGAHDFPSRPGSRSQSHPCSSVSTTPHLDEHVLKTQSYSFHTQLSQNVVGGGTEGCVGECLHEDFFLLS